MIAIAWKNGRALLSVGGTTISMNRHDATALALHLGNGQYPVCVGYPILTDAAIGDHVITEVTRVASGNTIMKIARVTDYVYNTALDLDEVYTDAGTVSLTPAERDALVDQLKNGDVL